MKLPLNIEITPLQHGPYSHGYWGIRFNHGTDLNYHGNSKYGRWAVVEISLGKWKRWDGYQLANNVSLVYGLHFRWGQPEIVELEDCSESQEQRTPTDWDENDHGTERK